MFGGKGAWDRLYTKIPRGSQKNQVHQMSDSPRSSNVSPRCNPKESQTTRRESKGKIMNVRCKIVAAVQAVS